MIGKLLTIGSMFDWITPALSLARSLGGGWVGYNVSIDAAPALAIRRLLLDHDVDVKGLQIVYNPHHGELIVFQVRREQAGYAEYLLQAAYGVNRG